MLTSDPNSGDLATPTRVPLTGVAAGLLGSPAGSLSGRSQTPADGPGHAALTATPDGEGPLTQHGTPEPAGRVA